MTNLSFLEKSVEEDYAGFNDKVNSATIDRYNRLKDSLHEEATLAGSSSCYKLLKRYLAFFREPHLNLFVRNANGYLDSLRDVFKDEPRIPIQLSELKERWVQGKGDPLEGIWRQGSSYEIAMLKDPAIPGDYLGIVLKADSICWFPGQLKMRFSTHPGGKYTVTFYGRDHTPLTPTTIVRSNSLVIDGYGTWLKTFPVSKEPVNPDGFGSEVVSFKVLSKDACVLTIKSFDQEYVKTTDSIIKANLSIIERTRNLIIDLRENGGGVSDCFFSLFPLIYTGPIPYDEVYLRSSPGNIAIYEKWKNNPLLSNAKSKAVQEFIDSMKAEPGKMVRVRKGITITLDSILEFPRKIGVLVDYGCASATEGFLINCHYSKKVTIFGSHTHGGYDYSEVVDTRSMPCPYMYYLCPAGKRGLKVYPPIDNIGIQPDVPLDETIPDWVAYAVKYLGREKTN
ncbi:S41 family peptidase [Dinghuibacter silviterrae]|uniref:S41 family peptidase n=1 Tax=Dinghuibacter silviterrae TaxID=1539049 RepID=UPI0013C32135|nr:S41 family peptidase [Dinghuibacter silviterrae]